MLMPTNTDVNATRWRPETLGCTIVTEGPDPNKTHRRYVWKHNDKIIYAANAPDGLSYTIPSIDEEDATGWKCEVRDYATEDYNGGDNVLVDTQTYAITIGENPHVEALTFKNSYNVGDEMTISMTYRVVLQPEDRVELYYNSGKIQEFVGDDGNHTRIFKIAKFAWPDYAGVYKVVLYGARGDVYFVKEVYVSVAQKKNTFNAQKWAPAYVECDDDAPISGSHTLKKYRLERSDGTLLYESTDRNLIITRSAVENDAGSYTVVARAYDPNDSNSYSEGSRRKITVRVKENEFFDDSYSTQSFRFPSGSNVNFSIRVKQADPAYLKHYGMFENNIYFTWMVKNKIVKSKRYGDGDYNEFSLSDVQFDNSVALQLIVSQIVGVDGQRQTIKGRPLFFDRHILDIYDKENVLPVVEIGEPIKIKISDKEPPMPSPDLNQTRSLVILKNNVLLREIPIESTEFTITDSAEKSDEATYSHEYRNSPSRDPYSEHEDYEIASRETYVVKVTPNMDFSGPEHAQVVVGGNLKLEAEVLKEPGDYVPSYEFYKGDQKLVIENPHNPVYTKNNVTKGDAGVYKFVAYADSNNNNQWDDGEHIGYTKYVHVVVHDAPPEPPKRAELVTLFSDFSKGRTSPCPYWVIDELVDLMEDPHLWAEKLSDAVYYDWQVTIFNEFLKGKDLFLQDSCNGYWAIIRQHDMSIETGYGRFKHYLGRN